MVTTWICPFMPRAAAEIARQLGLDAVPAWPQSEEWGVLKPGAKLEAPTPIFPRIDKKTMQDALNRAEVEARKPAAVETPSPPPGAGKSPPAPASAVGAEPGHEAPEDATITIDDFAKVELRVAEVLSAERVPKADKLLHLRVSLGDEERTVLAGMAEHYEPEALVGRKVIMVANLAPRKMRGLVFAGHAPGRGSGRQSQPAPAGPGPAGRRAHPLSVGKRSLRRRDRARGAQARSGAKLNFEG